MELIDFIKNNENWRDALSKEPYFLDVKEENGFTLLKYNQIKSDFSEKIVRECRGIILDSGNNIVCYPFEKFFNYSEQYADEIDWSSARVQEKIDGSIMKLWYAKNGCWMLSTNSCIDAYEVELNMNDLLKVNCPFKTFGDLFEHANNFKDIDLNALNQDYTYMFELVSPYNKVVISYPETMIYHIGTRDNKTGKEINVDIGVRKPKQYNIHTLEDCIRCASDLPSDAEGYVVVDKYWRRVKIKNPIYLQLHRMISNNQLQMKDAVKMILDNEQNEFLSYFPEYSNVFNNIQLSIDRLRERINEVHKHISIISTKKDFALKVMELDRENSNYYFRCYDDPNYTYDEWIRQLNINKLVEKLK